ncbi:MAG: vapC [Bryobacterales bacterium]|nr:vapC [Bryobacterales bacterium]
MVAWLLDQSPAQRVAAFFQKADAGNLRLLMSWINIGEVYYIATRRLGRERADQFLRRVPSLPIHIELPDESDIISAARLKSGNRLAYADAFAAALAIRESASVITGDPELRALTGILKVDWIGGES